MVRYRIYSSNMQSNLILQKPLDDHHLSSLSVLHTLVLRYREYDTAAFSSPPWWSDGVLHAALTQILKMSSLCQEEIGALVERLCKHLYSDVCFNTRDRITVCGLIRLMAQTCQNQEKSQVKTK